MKKKKIIIAVVVIILLLAAAGVVVWRVFFPDLFKSKQDVFWDKAQATIGLKDPKFTDYSKLLNEYKSVSGKGCKTELNLSADLDLSSSNIDSDTQDLINNSTIKLESNVAESGKRVQEKIGLYTDKSEVLTLDVVTDGDKYGIKCADLSDKYYTVSLDDLLDYIEKNTSNSSLGTSKNSYSSKSKQIAKSTDSIKDSITKLRDIDPYELLYISEDDLKHFDSTYGDIFKKYIPKDCYSTEKNVEIKIDGKEVKTTGYYLTMTGKDAYNFVKDLADVVKKDDVLSKIIAEKANIFLESMGEDTVDADDLSDSIAEMLDQLVSSAESLQDYDDEAIQIAIYNNKSSSRIDINHIADVDKPNKKETIVTIENTFSKNTDNEKAGKLTLSASKITVATVDYEIIDKKDESKIALSIDIPEGDMNLSVNMSTKGNYEKEPVSVEGSFKVSYKGESAEIKFDGTVEFTDDVSVPELTSKNSIDILNLSEKEQQEELDKLLKKASEVLPARLKLLGINVKAEDIYKEKVQTENNNGDKLTPPTTDSTTTPSTDSTTNPTTDSTTTPSTNQTNPATNNLNVTMPNMDEIQKNIDNVQQTIEKNQDLINSLQN